MLLDAVGDKIRQLREAKGLSQAAIGQLIDVSKQTISQWERGAAQPRAGHLSRLAALFGVAPSEIYQGAPTIPEDALEVGERVATLGRALPIVNLGQAAQILLGEATPTQIKSMTRRIAVPCFPVTRDAVYISIEDDANSPTLLIDDLVVIAADARPQPGKIVLARVGGRAVLRRYLPVEAETIEGAILQAENPRWPKLVVRSGDVVIGVMTERVTRSHG